MVCLVRAVITRRLAFSLVILEQVTSKKVVILTAYSRRPSPGQAATKPKIPGGTAYPKQKAKKVKGKKVKLFFCVLNFRFLKSQRVRVVVYYTNAQGV